MITTVENSVSVTVELNEEPSDSNLGSNFVPYEHSEISGETMLDAKTGDRIHNDSSQREKRVPWRSGDPYLYPIPKKGDSWGNCYKLVQKYDKEMCDAWKEEVDKLLIFAGLFSAAVTAFTIESYQWLEEDPRDTSTRILAQITLQLSRDAFNVTVPQMMPALVQEPFLVPTSVVRINIFWFLSLTLSLGTVLAGISCMQWLREFQRDAALPHKDALALRQMRFEGLMSWHVPSILSSLPLLLQSAVILFFAGLLDLLWTLNKTVATFFTVAVSLIVLFLVITTTAPFFQYFLLGDKHFQVDQCAYKSPQSWAFYWFGMSILHLLTWSIQLTSQIKWMAPSLLKLRRSLHDQNWIEYDIRQWRRLRDVDDLAYALTWIDRTFAQSVDVVHSVYHCLLDLQISTAAHIVSDLNPSAANRMQEILDDQSLMMPSFAEQTREIITASFLERHRLTHHTLTTNYLESIIRILNTQDIQPFIEWPVSNLLELPADIIEQFLMCVKLSIARERATAQHIITIWAVVQQTLRKPITPGAGARPPYADLGFAIIGEFEQWLTRPSETMVKRDKVALCVYGMIKVFKPSINPLSLWTKYPEATSLVWALDGYLVELGGGAVFLTHFTNQQWQALVEALNSPGDA